MRLGVRMRGGPGRCAVCHDDPGDAADTCPACQTTIHPDCRGELGRCPTLGCDGRAARTRHFLLRTTVLRPGMLGESSVEAERAAPSTGSPPLAEGLRRVLEDCRRSLRPRPARLSAFFAFFAAIFALCPFFFAFLAPWAPPSLAIAIFLAALVISAVIHAAIDRMLTRTTPRRDTS